MAVQSALQKGIKIRQLLFYKIIIQLTKIIKLLFWCKTERSS